MQHCHVNGLQQKTDSKKQIISRRKSSHYFLPSNRERNEIVKHPQSYGQHTLIIHTGVKKTLMKNFLHYYYTARQHILKQKFIYQASHQGKMTSIELLQKLISC